MVKQGDEVDASFGQATMWDLPGRDTASWWAYCGKICVVLRKTDLGGKHTMQHTHDVLVYRTVHLKPV